MQNADKKNALYFYHLYTSFIGIDTIILRKKFNVLGFEFKIKSQLSIPLLWLRQLVFLIKNRRAKLIFCMFGGYHTIVPSAFGKIFNIPVIIVAGGIDSVSFPSVNYGNFNKKILGKITEWSYKLSSVIAPISDYLVNSEYTYQPDDFPRQGFLYHCKNLKTPSKVIHNGFVLEKWFYNNEPRNPNSFLTIAANLDSISRVKIKGVDLIIETAKFLPQCNFTIIGRDSDTSALYAPSNVKIVPFIEYEKLRTFYCEHQYYLQVSMSEGFGNTLAESMLCECVPIGANAGAIPQIIDNTGFILTKKDPQLLKQVIEKALLCDKEKLGKAARNRIIENYGIDKREGEMLKLIDSILV